MSGTITLNPATPTIITTSGSYDVTLGQLGGSLQVTGTGVTVDVAIAGFGAGDVISVDTGAELIVDSMQNLSLLTGFTIGNEGTLAFAAGVNSALGAAVDFAGVGTLITEPGFSTGLLGAGIGGFGVGDVIDLQGVPYSSTGETVSLLSGILSINDNGSLTSLTLNNPVIPTGDVFHLGQDLKGGLVLSLVPAPPPTSPCFCAGTMIATQQGDVAVEHLAIGDHVKTLSGAFRPIKWIGKRSYRASFAAGNPDIQPVLVRASALSDNVPSQDLYVSPLHALYLLNMLIPAANLINHQSICRAPEVDPIDYFHIELATHDVIFANGAPAETFLDCDSRMLFHNAAEFAALYPHDLAPSWDFCAPRVQEGHRLDMVRAALALRAGIEMGAMVGQTGPLQGAIDQAGWERVSGWAFMPESPESRVRLTIHDGDVDLGEVTANRFRRDLAEAGMGDGRCGFEFTFPRRLAPTDRHELRIARASDAAPLSGSPLLLDPACRFSPTLEADLEQLLARGLRAAQIDQNGRADLDRMMAFFGRQMELIGQARTGVISTLDQRGPAKTALIIDDELPHINRDAGAQALFSHALSLVRLGYRVSLCPARQSASDAALAASLAGQGVDILTGLKVEQVLRAAPDHFDLVYLHRLSNAAAYGALARQTQGRARIIFSLADLHHLRLARQACVSQETDLMGQSRAAKAQEIWAMRLADAVITHSPAEAAYLAREVPQAETHIVPWHANVSSIKTGFAERVGIVMAGYGSHIPNQDGVRWLLNHVMPIVWQSLPAMPVLIAGAHWPDIAEYGTNPRVRHLGHVADLHDLFSRVRLSVAPLRFGAGLKGKVLDSLAHGLPCAMTSIAAEGFALPDTLRACVADDPAAQAAIIIKLHEDEALNSKLARAGRALVKRDFSEKAVDQAMRCALAGLAQLSNSNGPPLAKAR